MSRHGCLLKIPGSSDRILFERGLGCCEGLLKREGVGQVGEAGVLSAEPAEPSRDRL